MKDNYIYIVFSKTGTWLSRSIGIVTSSNYTHVSISLDSNFDNMYSFGRLNPNNPFSGGLTKESLYEGVFKKSPHCKCLIYKIPVTEKQLTKLEQLLSFYISLNKEIKYRYNFIGLFAVLVDKPLKRNRHFFCSQFITLLLEESKIWTSTKVPELTRPTDIMKMENKTILYEGFLNDFENYNCNLSTIAL